MEVARTQHGLATCKEPPSCFLSSLCAMALQPAKSPPLASFPPSLQWPCNLQRAPLLPPFLPLCKTARLYTPYTYPCRTPLSPCACSDPSWASVHHSPHTHCVVGNTRATLPQSGRRGHSAQSCDQWRAEKPCGKQLQANPHSKTSPTSVAIWQACPTGPLGALLIFAPPQCIPPNSRPLEVPGWTSGPPVPTPTETHRAALSGDNGHGCLKSHDTSSPCLGGPLPASPGPKPQTHLFRHNEPLVAKVEWEI